MSAGAGFPLGRLAEVLEATLDAHPERVVTGVASPASAGLDDLAYVADRRQVESAHASRAGAFLAPEEITGLPAPTLRCRDPRRALAVVLALFHPSTPPAPGVDASARVAPDARIDPTASVGALTVIASGASVGARVRLGPLVYVGEDVTIGEDSVLFPHAVIYGRCRLGRRVIVHAGAVIGADGFGFVPGPDGHLKIPQVGIVVVQDDVEIGANSTIDRATLGETVVGRGTKVDNLVHIGHNVEVGERCLMAAQVGIAGSVRIGNDVMLAGQVGISDHVNVGDAAVLEGQSGVFRDVPEGQRFAGSWARPAAHFHPIGVAEAKLPDQLRSGRTHERRVATLEKRAGERGVNS
jgi:UDP-3-O-[3-hydroxymyristoyl] glucosamine N-acyltransferase